MSFDEFWEEERRKITDKDLIKPIRRMYSESLELSEDWGRRFLEFWDPPRGFRSGGGLMPEYDKKTLENRKCKNLMEVRKWKS